MSKATLANILRFDADTCRAEFRIGQTHSMTHASRRRGRETRLSEHDSGNAEDTLAAWPGVYGGRYRPLTEGEVVEVHETALELLCELGMSQATPTMVERVTACGGRFTQDRRLLFPRELVERCISQARRDVVLHGRRDELAARLAVQVLGERRPARILDSAVYDANNERLRR